MKVKCIDDKLWRVWNGKEHRLMGIEEGEEYTVIKEDWLHYWLKWVDGQFNLKRFTKITE